MNSSARFGWRRFRVALAFMVAMTCLIFANSLLAAAPAEQKSYPPQPQLFKKLQAPSIKNHLRLSYGVNDNAAALQTSIVRFEAADVGRAVTVDLIAAVHIADGGYYDKLNWIFEDYDVVLYELVAPPDKRIPVKGRNTDNPLRLIQKISESVLDLSYQLDCIDYKKENFVHADLSPEQIQRAMSERGDDPFTVMLGVLADMLRQNNIQQRKLEENPDRFRDLAKIDPLELLFDPNGAIKLKRIMAKQFAHLSETGSALGPTLDTILIKDRNKAAMQMLQKQLDGGKQRIGIFYGAAHMPDFEQRLVRDFGLCRGRVRWLTAWDLERRSRSPAEGLLSQLLEELLRP